MDAVVLEATAFDYSLLDQQARDEVRAAAQRIRLRMSRTCQDIIEIGRDLIAVKDRVGHGGFLKWIDAEFAMSNPTASRFMNVAEQFGGKSFSVKDLTPTALYELAAPSTSPEVREEVEQRAADGEDVSAAEIRRLKKQLTEVKDKVKDEKANSSDFGDQVTSLQQKLQKLQEQNRELEDQLAVKRGASNVKPADDPRNDIEVLEAQVAAMMAAWNKASKEAREEFLLRIDTPTMDRRFS